MTISAIIPTYNRRAHIFRSIDSVLAQTVPVDEIIVVDDGSTDGTAEAILIRYGSRVKVVRQENMGVSAARKTGVDHAQEEWIAFLDSDDEWLPERNGKFLKAAQAVPQNVALIFGNTRFITDQGDGTTVFEQNGLAIRQDLQLFNDPLAELVWDMNLSRPCVLQSSFLRRPVLLELNCFSESLRHSEDFLAGIQIATKYSFAAIPSIVTKLNRTSDLSASSLEPTWRLSDDHYRATVIGYACAARATGSKTWRSRHADAVRGLCKWHAKNGTPFRRLALTQFEFGVSLRSILFLCGAALGPGFFRAGFAVKGWLRALWAAVHGPRVRTLRFQ